MEIKLPFLKEPVGAGDVAKAATAAIGVPPCGGCQKRASAMNGALTFVPRKNIWECLPQTPEGWEKESSYTTDGRLLEFYAKPDGHVMIWEAVDGKYLQSFGFCCSNLRWKAMEKWRELCR